MQDALTGGLLLSSRQRNPADYLQRFLTAQSLEGRCLSGHHRMPAFSKGELYFRQGLRNMHRFSVTFTSKFESHFLQQPVTSSAAYLKRICTLSTRNKCVFSFVREKTRHKENSFRTHGNFVTQCKCPRDSGIVHYSWEMWSFDNRKVVALPRFWVVVSTP